MLVDRWLPSCFVFLHSVIMFYLLVLLSYWSCLIAVHVQTFCQTEGIVREVLARVIQMSWNFACLFLCSYLYTFPNFSPIQSSMWAQDQIFDSGNIFRLWSKCILYCFINSEKIPDHAPTYITSLHKFGTISLNQYFSKILARFWSVKIAVKEVPFWSIQLVWNC